MVRLREQQKLQKALDDDPDEDLEVFEHQFSQKIRTIRERIQILSASASLDTTVTQIHQEVKQAEDFLNQSLHFLAGYAIKHSQELIQQMTDELRLKQELLNPRKPFAFRRRQVKKEAETVQQPQATAEIQVILEGIEGLESASVTKSDEELRQCNCYQLKNLTNCEVMLLGRLKAIHMSGLKNCRVFVGPVSGAAHITGCTDCQIVVASHQLRIHTSTQCEFYVFATTEPIVESVSQVGFAPYCLKYSGIEEQFEEQGLNGVNKWNQVKDFKWLKQGASPNWRVLDEDQRIPQKELQ